MALLKRITLCRQTMRSLPPIETSTATLSHIRTYFVSSIISPHRPSRRCSPGSSSCSPSPLSLRSVGVILTHTSSPLTGSTSSCDAQPCIPAAETSIKRHQSSIHDRSSHLASFHRNARLLHTDMTLMRQKKIVSLASLEIIGSSIVQR